MTMKTDEKTLPISGKCVNMISTDTIVTSKINQYQFGLSVFHLYPDQIAKDGGFYQKCYEDLCLKRKVKAAQNLSANALMEVT